jgi:hypothetical protein
VTWPYPKDLNLPLDFGHPLLRRLHVVPSDELDCDLLAPLGVKTELDLPKLAFAEGLKQKVRAKLRNCPAGVGLCVGDGGRVGVDVARRTRTLSSRCLHGLLWADSGGVGGAVLFAVRGWGG